jgi:hypothetical protein
MANPPSEEHKPASSKRQSLLNRIGKVTAHPVIAPLIVTAVLAAVAGTVSYVRLSSHATTPPAPPSAGSSAQGFSARVAWTNDGGGGGSESTNLYSFAGPDSNLHAGVYTLGESLTVVCETPRGRAIQVGPAYEGPDPHSTKWYQLDNGSWVPAVYTYVAKASSVPACDR